MRADEVKSIPRTCKHCGGGFLSSRKRVRANKANYCSTRCGSKAYHSARSAKHICYVCGVQFQRAPRLFRLCSHKFCSSKCYGAYRSQTLVGSKSTNFKSHWVDCDFCGKQILRPECFIKIKNYCSQSCDSTNRIKNRIRYFSKRQEYGGVTYRSSWEAGFARWLDNSGLKWQYEPEAFNVGGRWYVPDFWIEEWGCFWEIKGWFDERSRGKVSAFRKHHDIPLVVADGSVLKSLGVSLN